MLNRSISPDIRAIEELQLIHPEKLTLKNGYEVFLLNAGTQDISKIEFLFPAGSLFQNKTLQAKFTNRILTEGAGKYSSKAVSNLVEYYGAYLYSENGPIYSEINFLSLNKYHAELAPLLHAVIHEPHLSQKELEILVQNEKQKFKIEGEKVAELARRNFNALLFGQNSTLGKIVSENDFDNVNDTDLKDFFEKHYQNNPIKIVVSGKIDSKIESFLNNLFGANSSSPKNKTIELKTSEIRGQQLLCEKTDAIQSAIRIGKLLVNPKNDDFFKLKILNTVLGGYFGSRLMSNIREDKGYTYGIGSRIVAIDNMSYLFIATEVGADVCKNAIDEIYFEIEKLQTELISESELSLVKKYMLGSLLRSLDGPFAQADRFKEALLMRYDLNFFNRLVKEINEVTSFELRDLAIKYFNKNEMIQVVAGKI